MNGCAIISAPANALQLFEHPTAQESLFAIECLLQRRYLCDLTVKWRGEVWFSLRFHNERAQGSLFAIECELHRRYLCDFTMNRRREVYLRFNAYYSAVISAIWPLNGAGKFDFLCDFTMNGRREVYRSALELYFSSLREWILMKFRIQNPYAIDKLTSKRYQNTLTEWGEINYFVRPSGFFWCHGRWWAFQQLFFDFQWPLRSEVILSKFWIIL